MVGDWKSSDGVPLCEAPNWQSTPLWCPPSGHMGPPGACSTQDGVALEEARRTKDRKYRELAGNGGRVRVGGRGRSVGRFSVEANQFLQGVVSGRVRDVPDLLKVKVVAVWSCRWRSMLANSHRDGEVLLLSDVLGADRHR